MLLTCEPGEQDDAMSVWVTEGSSDNGHPVDQTQQHWQKNTQRCWVKGLISWITGFSLPFSNTRVWCTLCRQSQCSASQLILLQDFASNYTRHQVATQHSTKTSYRKMSNQKVLKIKHQNAVKSESTAFFSSKYTAKCTCNASDDLLIVTFKSSLVRSWTTTLTCNFKGS